MQYGVVEIDGVQYVERAQVFPADLNVTTANQVFTQQRITLPGVANFLLKGLTREVTQNSASSSIRFKFRLGNSDGLTWYISGGIGSTTDRVIDSAVFGTGSFPYPIVPSIAYSAGSNIIFEVEDFLGVVPYTINFGFHGAYLIPVGASTNGG